MDEPSHDDNLLELHEALARAHALGVSDLASMDDDMATHVPVADIYLALTEAVAITRVAAYNRHLAAISSSYGDTVRASLSLYQARWLYAQLRRLARDAPEVRDIPAYLESVVQGGPPRSDRRLVALSPEHWLHRHRAGTYPRLTHPGRAHRRSSLGSAWTYTAGQLPLLRYAAIDTVNLAVEMQLNHEHPTDRSEDLRRDFQENSPVYWRSPATVRADLTRRTFAQGEQLARALESKHIQLYVTSVRHDRLSAMECIADIDPTLVTCALAELPLRFSLCCTARAAFDRKWFEQVAAMESVPSVDQCEAAIDDYIAAVNSALRDRNSEAVMDAAKRHPNYLPLASLATAAFEDLKPLGIARDAAEIMVSQTAHAALLDQTYSRAEIGYPDPEIVLGTAIDSVKAEQARGWPKTRQGQVGDRDR